jgi:hypothetical protein
LISSKKSTAAVFDGGAKRLKGKRGAMRLCGRQPPERIRDLFSRQGFKLAERAAYDQLGKDGRGGDCRRAPLRFDPGIDEPVAF